jgi:hypothetical protein
MTFDVKGIVAVLVVIGSFGLLGVYVLHGQVPDATISGIIGTALGLVLGFYFGHVNGVAQAAANQAAQLSIQASTILQAAQQRRAGDPRTDQATTPPIGLPSNIPPVGNP